MQTAALVTSGHRDVHSRVNVRCQPDRLLHSRARDQHLAPQQDSTGGGDNTPAGPCHDSERPRWLRQADGSRNSYVACDR